MNRFDKRKATVVASDGGFIVVLPNGEVFPFATAISVSCPCGSENELTLKCDVNIAESIEHARLKYKDLPKASEETKEVFLQEVKAHVENKHLVLKRNAN